MIINILIKIVYVFKWFNYENLQSNSVLILVVYERSKIVETKVKKIKYNSLNSDISSIDFFFSKRKYYPIFI